jgi:hypothetical protein
MPDVSGAAHPYNRPSPISKPTFLRSGLRPFQIDLVRTQATKKQLTTNHRVWILCRARFRGTSSRCLRVRSERSFSRHSDRIRGVLNLQHGILPIPHDERRNPCKTVVLYINLFRKNHQRDIHKSKTGYGC